MPPRPKKPSFGENLVEAMKLVLAIIAARSNSNQVSPKRRSPTATPKRRISRAK